MEGPVRRPLFQRLQLQWCEITRTTNGHKIKKRTEINASHDLDVRDVLGLKEALSSDKANAKYDLDIKTIINHHKHSMKKMKTSNKLTTFTCDYEKSKDDANRVTSFRLPNTTRMTLRYLLVLLLVVNTKVSAMNLCVDKNLVGTRNTGHYEFRTEIRDVTTIESKKSTNHDWQGTQGDIPLPLKPNATIWLRVASYNIRAAFPSDRGSDCEHPFGWEYRVDQVAEQINFYHPDVIGIQEDTHYQIAQLEPLLSNYRFVGVNRDDCETSPEDAKSPLNPFGITRYDGDCEASKQQDALVRGGEFNSIWYRPDVLDLQKWGVFWLGKETAQPGSHFLNTTCTLGNFTPSCDVGRIVTWAHFRPKTQPYDFFVFNTHVTSNSEGKKKSPATLIRKIKDIAGSKLTYTLGDFNTAQFSSLYKEYQSYLNDPDNPHPNEAKALRQWPPEAVNSDLRRGGQEDPPHGTFGPFVDSKSQVYDFIWGYHIRVLSMLNDRLGNATQEERRRLRSDHRMLLASVELKPEYFFHQDVENPLDVGRGDTSSAFRSSRHVGFVAMLILLVSLSCWASGG